MQKHSLLFLFLLFSVSCDKRPPQPIPQPQVKAETPNDVPKFDAQRAFRYLTMQTDFGPRNAASLGHAKCLRFLQDELGMSADRVVLQEFTHSDSKSGQYKYSNVIAEFNPKAIVRILLTAHWDTRPWADNDQDPKNHNKPILGANDGASGVAVLLEIARQLKAQQPSVGVDMVFFDCEDVGIRGDQRSYAIGSQYFAKNLPKGFNPRFAINLDMIGDKALTIPREINSDRYAPHVMQMIFSTASDLAVAEFVNGVGEEIFDDHIPLNEAGIRAVDIIDFNYPDNSNRYWHSLDDTPDKCSPQSLEAVGKVLLEIIYTKTITF